MRCYLTSLRASWTHTPPEHALGFFARQLRLIINRSPNGTIWNGRMSPGLLHHWKGHTDLPLNSRIFLDPGLSGGDI